MKTIEEGIIWNTKNINNTYVRFQRFLKKEHDVNFNDREWKIVHSNEILNFINGKLDTDLCTDKIPNTKTFFNNTLKENFVYITMSNTLVCKITHNNGNVFYIGSITSDNKHCSAIKYQNAQSIHSIEIIDSNSINKNDITKLPSIYKF